MEITKKTKTIWVSIYLKQPKQGQVVTSRFSHQEGFVSQCTWNNGFFETYKDHGNRFEITRWKTDEWTNNN